MAKNANIHQPENLGIEELKRRIKGFRGHFKLDITEDYLNNSGIDRLRRVLLAAKAKEKTRGGNNYERYKSQHNRKRL